MGILEDMLAVRARLLAKPIVVRIWVVDAPHLRRWLVARPENVQWEQERVSRPATILDYGLIPGSAYCGLPIYEWWWHRWHPPLYAPEVGLPTEPGLYLEMNNGMLLAVRTDSSIAASFDRWYSRSSYVE